MDASLDRMEDILASSHWLAGNAVALVCRETSLRGQTPLSVMASLTYLTYKTDPPYQIPLCSKECCEVSVYI